MHDTDLVQDLLYKLELWLGIPTSYQRLLFKGKQLKESLPLSFYSIQRDATIVLTFRLRGGSFGQTSSTPPFSYKDAVHKDTAQPQPSSRVAQLAMAPKPFLVDKLEEVPSVELIHPMVADLHQKFAETAIICRFNGLWPRTTDLYQ